MLNKLKELREKNEGFTIIEVVIVLAIAGLIFAIVFVAVPQLQASQRDTTRRSDAGRLVAGITQYTANNNGSLPADASTVTSGVVGTYVDDFGTYSIADDNGDTSTAVDTVEYGTGQNCDGSGGSRAFFVRIGLEQGGSYCVDG